jgi:tRNA-dihydrouridine synthase 3
MDLDASACCPPCEDVALDRAPLAEGAEPVALAAAAVATATGETAPAARHMEHYNFVKVKPEYLLAGPRAVPTDQAQPAQEKGWRKRTQAMRDGMSEAAAARPKLCNFVNRGQPCPFETCRFSHDVETYLATRPADLGARCPVLDATGVCQMGFSCRFVGAHLLPEHFSAAARGEGVKPSNSGLLQSLQRKEYRFEGSHVRASERRAVELRGKVYVAPLTTVGNLPFRRVLVGLGADVTCGEMAMARQLLRGSASEWALTKRHPSEKLFGIQLAGCDPRELAKAAELVSRETDADFIDLNMGCPIAEVTDHGAGSALLQRPARIHQVVAAITAAAPNVSLGLKMRTGWSDDKPVAHQVIRDLKVGACAWRRRTVARSPSRGEEQGQNLAYVMVHGRSRLARYTKKANWDYVASECAPAAMEAGLQFLGNGDVMSWMDYEMAVTSKAEGGHGVGAPVAAALIARGALVKPWICTEIKERRVWDIAAQERLDLYRSFANFGLEHWGSDQRGVDNTRRYMLEWLSFAHRYVPAGILERPQHINERPPNFVGRSDLETLLASPSARDWEKISEMCVGGGAAARCD